MAKSKSRTRRTGQTPNPDLAAQMREVEPDVIETDLSQISSPIPGKMAFLQSDSGEIPLDLFLARDAMMNWLGGYETFADSRARAFSVGQSLGLENMLGVGVGIKESRGKTTGDLVIKVYVKQKSASHNVSDDALIPEEIDGIPTDVEETGILRSLSLDRRFERPVPCGVSCGHPNITAGTIGALVILENNKVAILSNNHVLANENDAQIGDLVIQPGPVDGGNSPSDNIARLEDFEPLRFLGTNEVDAAVAVTNFNILSPRHAFYTLNPSIKSATLGMTVLKNGRTTGSTSGWVDAVGVNGMSIEYNQGIAEFSGQVVIKGLNGSKFSASGDSGSLVVDMLSKSPVGLLFAGGDSHTVANPIQTVMKRLKIKRFVAPP